MTARLDGAPPDASRKRTPEAALAAVVVAWLVELGADVYEEVELSRGGIRADIVARLGAELWIIETKASLSLSLVGQCMERRRLAHRVYAAAPCRKLRISDELFRDVGIGLLDVRLGTQHAWDPARIVEMVPSKRWNTRPVALAGQLRPEHKTHARAGAPAGGHWTPFRETCENLARAVAREPGITLKAAIAAIEHHYRSIAGARSSMATWIKAGKVPGVRLEAGKLYPSAVALSSPAIARSAL